MHFLRTLLVTFIFHIACFRLCHVTKLLRWCLRHLVLCICVLFYFFPHLFSKPFINAHSYSKHSMYICIEHVCGSCSIERSNTQNIFHFSLPIAPTLRIFCPSPSSSIGILLSRNFLLEHLQKTYSNIESYFGYFHFSSFVLLPFNYQNCQKS